jgi:aminomethyltransferase
MGNFQELSDLKKTIKISARRFEESPYIERTDHPEMVRGVYAGRYFAISLGEDPIQKYWLLRQKAAMFDVPEKPIEISGPDAAVFLEKVMTRKVSTIKEGRGYYSLACTPQGGIFMDGVIFKFNENKFWYVQADGPFEDWLLAHSAGFDVKILDPKSRVIQIQGPASIDIMKAASNGKIDENMPYYRSGFFDLGGQNLYVSRSGLLTSLV